MILYICKIKQRKKTNCFTSYKKAFVAVSTSTKQRTVTKARKGGVKVYTDYGYIGNADGILYCSDTEALEANPDN